MNTQQTAALRVATLRLQRRCHEGALSFNVEQLDGGSLLLAATNIHGDLRWFETAQDFYAVVGPRGGIRQYAGNLNAK